jgi:chaperonin GroEL
VTVAREIEHEDPLENMGAQLAKEIASKVEQDAGDGTTTSLVLAEAILNEGMRQLAAGAMPVHVHRGVLLAAQAVDEELRRSARPVASHEELVRVAASAANQDREIGEVVAEALERSQGGWVTVEAGDSNDTKVEWEEGLQFDRGYLSPYFVTDAERLECVLEKPYVLIHEQKLSSATDLLPLLEEAVKEGQPLLVIAESVDDGALATLVLNHMRGIARSCAVKAPGFGAQRKNLLDDLAVLTGGQAVLKDLGVKLGSLTLSDLGRADRVVIDRETTTIIGSRADHQGLDARVRLLRAELEEATAESDRENLEGRLANLTGGVARIEVGGFTEAELKERTDRVRDALNAARAAQNGGVVPGAGLAYLQASRVLERDLGKSGDERSGVIAVRRALEAPLHQIAENAGTSPGVVIERCRREGLEQAFDAVTLTYVDPTVAGIVDPVKVVRSALRAAASIASLLLTTEASVSALVAKRGRRKPSSAA